MSPHREPGGRRANDAASIDATLAALAQRLQSVATPARASHEKEYLKSNLEHWGATVPDARAAAKWLGAEYPEIRANPWPFVEACWAKDVYELRSTMSFFLERASLGNNGLERLEALCRQCHTWALVDQIAIHVVPRAKPPHDMLLRWAADPDRWIRRVALLCHVKELRAGKGNPEQWADLARLNFADEDAFIRKAIGWVLRDIGKKRPEWTEGFLLRHRDRMSALSVAEATRHLDLPPE